MSMQHAPPSSPYLRAPIRVAHAFVAGQQANDASECPYDAASAADEHGAWHRGLRLSQRLEAEG